MTAALNPHDGKELSLLMNGRKDIAVFDALVPKTCIVGQRKIPTNKFRPHVETGDLILSIHHYPESDFVEGAEGTRRFVVYARKGKEALIDKFYDLLEAHKGKGTLYHKEVGALFGYSDEQIEAFLAQAE